MYIHPRIVPERVFFWTRFFLGLSTEAFLGCVPLVYWCVSVIIPLCPYYRFPLASYHLTFSWVHALTCCRGLCSILVFSPFAKHLFPLSSPPWLWFSMGPPFFPLLLFCSELLLCSFLRSGKKEPSVLFFFTLDGPNVPPIFLSLPLPS